MAGSLGLVQCPLLALLVLLLLLCALVLRLLLCLLLCLGCELLLLEGVVDLL